jgi:hypothetical protein
MAADKKNTEYDAVAVAGLKPFVDAVNTKMREGWRLQGGISVTVCGMQVFYGQAFVR